jgi:hypothetical protein
MKTFDLYGFRKDNLEDARIAFQQALGVTMVPRDSLYLGGSYYRYASSGQENFMIRRNLDPFDGEPAELDFPDMPVLLYVNETERSRELEQILTTNIPSLVLLRRREI